MRIFDLTENTLNQLAKELRIYGFEIQDRISNEWVIHFSPDAPSIAVSGFTKGNPLGSNWELTHGSSQRGPGFNFAMPLDDYSLEEIDGLNFVSTRAVLFRIKNGLVVRHHRDNFTQVVFRGDRVIRPFVVIEAVPDEDGELYDGFTNWQWAVVTPQGLSEPDDLQSIIHSITE